MKIEKFEAQILVGGKAVYELMGPDEKAYVVVEPGMNLFC